VSVLFLHGPHFGDRYGIADAFVTALRNGDIPILALSCAVSSISAIIAGNDPDKAIEVLSTRFQTPSGKRR
jgi:aspartokinase